MIIRMTEVQKAYLIGRNNVFQGQNGTHMYAELSFSGDIRKFNKALNQVICRQPMLRAKVKNMNEFSIEPHLDYKIKVYNLNEKKDIISCKREELSHKLYRENDYPFFTFEAVENDCGYTMFVSIDLLIADGLSLFQLLQQIKSFYNNEKYEMIDKTQDLKTISNKYFEDRSSKKYSKSKEYWKKEIETLPSAPNLLIKDVSVKSSKFARKEFIFSEKELDILISFSKAEGLSLNTLLLLFYSETLKRYSESKDFSINMTTFKRPINPKYQEVIGDFTSTVLIDVKSDNQQDFKKKYEFLNKAVFVKLLNSHYEGLEVIRDLSRKKKHQVIMPYVFTSMLFDLEAFSDFVTIDYWISQTPQVYLDCQIKKMNGELHVSWDYLEAIFEEKQIKEMFTIFIKQIKLLIHSRSLSDFVPCIEHTSHLEDIYSKYNTNNIIWNFKVEDIVEKFNKNVENKPNSYLFSTNNEKITAQQLDNCSEKLAEKINFIKREKGLKKIRVGIRGDKSINSVISMLAVMKLKDSFCFIPEDIPKERMELLLSESDISIILHDGQINFLRSEVQEIPEKEMYIVFTSGTTGKPKGISINDKSALNTIVDVINRFSIVEEDVIFNISKLSFDLSIFDLIAPLILGNETILCPDISMFSEYESELLRTTVWNSTPGIVEALMRNGQRNLYKIQTIMMSGDFISMSLLENIQRFFNTTKVYSLGGATEASIWSIFYPLDGYSGNRIPYGYPLSNQKIVILDEHDQLVDPYCVGEICILGEGLSSGYLNSSDNEGVFYNHKRLGRIYRSGDKGYFHPDGYIHIIGRIKSELKVNGYRIDVLEIENALKKVEGIKAAKVIVKMNRNKKNYLSSFYLSDTPGKVSINSIRETLKDILPAYMIPTSFHHLDNFPLTKNGKIDTSYLISISSETDIEQLTPLEVKIARIWGDLIGIGLTRENNTIKKNETFFEAGGDSILLPELLNEFHKQLGVHLTIEELLSHFTLEEQAKLIYKMNQDSSQRSELNENIIQLKKGTTNKSIVLIHAGSGEIAIYNGLSKLLDSEHNVYAIRFDKNMEEIEPREIFFSELAVKYNSYLKSIPNIVLIGGWCIGGTIGYEIAKINKEIGSLLLINTMPPVENKNKNNNVSLDIDSERSFILNNIGYQTKEEFNTRIMWEEMINLLEQNPTLMPKLVDIVPKALSRLIPFFGKNNPRELIYYINLFRSFERARHLYDEETIINQSVIYIGAEQEVIPRFEKWGNLTNNHWTSMHVYGDHTTIFDAENVPNLADSINEFLKKKECN